MASPLGLFVGLFILMAIFAFVNGMSHSAANSFLLRRFVEIIIGITLFFVGVNTVRRLDEASLGDTLADAQVAALRSIAIFFTSSPPRRVDAGPAGAF